MPPELWRPLGCLSVNIRYDSVDHGYISQITEKLSSCLAVPLWSMQFMSCQVKSFRVSGMIVYQA